MSDVPESKGLALVIEDDFDASIIFAKALEVLGFKTEVISTGNEAQERLKTAAPVIVVLDLHLPEVTGTDLLRQIRQDERLKQTRVIITSADPRMAELIQDEADLILLKPTTFSQVRDLAERLLSKPRLKSKSRPRTTEQPAVAPPGLAATPDPAPPAADTPPTSTTP